MNNKTSKGGIIAAIVAAVLIIVLFIINFSMIFSTLGDVVKIATHEINNQIEEEQLDVYEDALDDLLEDTDVVQLVGSDATGYIKLSDEWHPFDNLDPSVTSIQYSDITGVNIISLEDGFDAFADMSVDEVASSIATNFSQSEIEGVEMARMDFGGYDSVQVYGLYPIGDDTGALVSHIFRDDNDKLYCITFEGYASDVITMISDASSTFSTTK